MQKIAITKIFKGLSDCYGTFAYMENDELVVGETIVDKTTYIYRGSIEAFRKSRDFLKLAARNRALADDIIDYYRYSYKKENKHEDTMDTVEDIIKRLWQHNKNYRQGKTQDFEQVFRDCLVAADTLYKYKNTEFSECMSEGAQKENMGTKLCEIKVDRKDSLQELVYHLTANGYRVETAVVWKKYPRENDIDYWMITIFDKE